jgi:hypothetical protein
MLYLNIVKKRQIIIVVIVSLLLVIPFIAFSLLRELENKLLCVKFKKKECF